MKSPTSLVRNGRNGARAIWAALLLGGALGLASCASDTSGRAAGLGEGAPPTISADRPGGVPLSPESTHAEESWKARYHAHEGPDAGGVIVVERFPGVADIAGVWVETHRTDSATVPFLEETFVRASGGGVALVESINRIEGVISKFDPPLIVMPASLAPGSTFKQTLTLTVHPIRSPDKVQDRGEATQEVTYLGDADVALAGGAPRPAAHVRSVFRVKLSAAAVVNTTDAWHALDARSSASREGPTLLARRDDESAKFLGVQVRAKNAFVSLDPGAPAAR